MTISATAASVTSMEFHHASANRQLLAVGDDQGTVHVMEVPRNLRRAANNEKAFAANFFAREEKRVEYVKRRLEQLKEEAGEAKAEGGGPPAEPKEGEPTEEEKLEAAFKEMELKFIEDMELQVGGEEGEPAPAEVS